MHDGRKISDLFHIKFISKHIKIDILFVSGLQDNLIYEEIVKKLGPETNPHPKPYPLEWVCEDDKLHLSKQCKLRFAITSKFIDDVELDVIPLNICGIVLVNPYSYDKKSII